MLKVLVVDDDKIIRMGLKTIINKSQKFNVIGDAPNGCRALELIKELKPDILITDIKMPVMDGIELIYNINRLAMNVKVIALSGFDDYKYVRNTMKSGAVDYLLKPIDNTALLELLEKVKADIEKEKLEQEKLERLNSEFAISSKAFKEKIFSELLNGNYKIDDLENFQDITEGINKFNLILLCKDDYYIEKKKDEFNLSIYLEETKGLIYEIINNSSLSKGVMLTEKEGRYIVVLVALDNASVENEIFLKNTAESIKAGIGSQSVTVVLSEAFNDLSAAQNMYKSMKQTLEVRFYLGKNKILTCINEENNLTALNSAKYDVLINDISKKVEIADSFKVRDKINELMEKLYKDRVYPAEFRKFLLQLTLKTSAIVPDFKQAIDIFTDEDEEIAFYIENIDTYFDLKEYLSSAYFNIVEIIKRLRSERSKKIIEKAKAYIEDNYKENISLKSVAEKVYLNPNYFSELFKNEVGINFIDYLIETRINAAKELLKKSGVKVYEVAQKVGYNEISSFNRTFKKVVGVTPKEYMELIK